jgi:hypothetical protein
MVFEPVYKGATTTVGIHPSRRPRFCPWPHLDATLRDRLVTVAEAYARAAGVIGLTEIEFIVSDDRIHLLEINPRLSATMRMTSVACGRSIFAELPRSRLDPDWPGASPRPVFFTAELPIPAGTDPRVLERLPEPRWLSSRVTLAAPSWRLLGRRLRSAARLLDLPLPDEGPPGSAR